MNKSRNEKLSDYLLEIDEDLLENAYAIDDAEKLKIYIKSKKDNRKTAFFLTPMFRRLAVAVACLMLVVAVIPFINTNTEPVALSYEGTPLTHEKVAVTQTTSLPIIGLNDVKPTGIPLEFKTHENAEISVSGGNLYGVSENGKEILSFGERTEITKDTTIWWAVLGGAGSYELTVTANGKESVYILEMYDSAPNDNEVSFILGPVQNGVIYKKTTEN